MTNIELMSTTNDIPAFTPSLGLRYWMNKMKRTASTGQDSNNKKDKNDSHLNPSNQTKLSSPITILTNSTTTTKGNVDIQSLGNKSLNDATSTVSISGITGSYFGIGSVNGYDIDSSLRVHHHGASSERSSFLSDDIQSNASIKSKPWISQLVSSTHNNSNHNDGEASSNSITNSGAHHSIRTFNSTEPSPITQHVYYYGREMDDDSADSADDDDDGIDGDIFGTSYHASHLVLPGNLQQISSNTNNNTSGNTESKQYQQQRRWSENGYPPHTLGRIKAGLGRLMGRDHPSSTSDNRGGPS